MRVLDCANCFGRWELDELIERRTKPVPDELFNVATWLYFCPQCWAPVDVSVVDEEEDAGP